MMIGNVIIECALKLQQRVLNVHLALLTGINIHSAIHDIIRLT